MNDEDRASAVELCQACALAEGLPMLPSTAQLHFMIVASNEALRMAYVAIRAVRRTIPEAWCDTQTRRISAEAAALLACGWNEGDPVYVYND